MCWPYTHVYPLSTQQTKRLRLSEAMSIEQATDNKTGIIRSNVVFSLTYFWSAQLQTQYNRNIINCNLSQLTCAQSVLEVMATVLQTSSATWYCSLRICWVDWCCNVLISCSVMPCMKKLERRFDFHFTAQHGFRNRSAWRSGNYHCNMCCL